MPLRNKRPPTFYLTSALLGLSKYPVCILNTNKKIKLVMGHRCVGGRIFEETKFCPNFSFLLKCFDFHKILMNLL